LLRDSVAKLYEIFWNRPELSQTCHGAEKSYCNHDSFYVTSLEASIEWLAAKSQAFGIELSILRNWGMDYTFKLERLEYLLNLLNVSSDNSEERERVHARTVQVYGEVEDVFNEALGRQRIEVPVAGSGGLVSIFPNFFEAGFLSGRTFYTHQGKNELLKVIGKVKALAAKSAQDKPTKKSREIQKHDFDPFRIMVGVLANRNDSDLLVSVCTAAGLQFDMQLSEQESSHKQRTRILLPRIFAAFDSLDDQARLVVANVALASISGSYWETKDRVIEMLSKAGWEVHDNSLVAQAPDLREMFLPAGSPWDAHVMLRNIFCEAKSALTIIDSYADPIVFQMLTARPLTGLKVQILCSFHAPAVAAEAKVFVSQYPGVEVEVRQARDFHDRFVIIDMLSCVHIGASIKDAGKKAFMVSRVEDPNNLKAILQALGASWDAAKPVT
jgi:hypothetical protein